MRWCSRHSKVEANQETPAGRRSKQLRNATKEREKPKAQPEQSIEKNEREMQRKRRAAPIEPPTAPPEKPLKRPRGRPKLNKEVPKTLNDKEDEEIDICSSPGNRQPLTPSAGLELVTAENAIGNNISGSMQAYKSSPVTEIVERNTRSQHPLSQSPGKNNNNALQAAVEIATPPQNKKLRFGSSSTAREESANLQLQPLSPSLSELHIHTAPSLGTSMTATEPLASIASTSPPAIGPTSVPPKTSTLVIPTAHPSIHPSIPAAPNIVSPALPAVAPLASGLIQQQLVRPSLAAATPPPLNVSFYPDAESLNPVQRAVVEYATASSQDPAQVWHSARKIAAHYTAKQLLTALEAGPPPQPNVAVPALKQTAGVSYIVPTESKQLDVSGQEFLPHMVYRPPFPSGLTELPETAPEVSEALQVLLHSPTTAVSMPLRDENVMKNYLLEHAKRAEKVQLARGTCEKVSGACDVASLLHDRSFLCLHYRLESTENKLGIQTLRVVPCLTSEKTTEAKDQSGDRAPMEVESTNTAELAELKAPEVSGNRAPTLEASHLSSVLADSNLQLGIMVRKGVGGTYPLRTAAKKVHSYGLLGALMDEALPSAQQHPSSGTDPISSTASAGMSEGSFQEGRSLFSMEGATQQRQQQQQDEGPPPAHQRLSLYTLSCRLELYVEQKTWDRLTA